MDGKKAINGHVVLTGAPGWDSGSLWKHLKLLLSGLTDTARTRRGWNRPQLCDPGPHWAGKISHATTEGAPKVRCVTPEEGLQPKGQVINDPDASTVRPKSTPQASASQQSLLLTGPEKRVICRAMRTPTPYISLEAEHSLAQPPLKASTHTHRNNSGLPAHTSSYSRVLRTKRIFSTLKPPDMTPGHKKEMTCSADACSAECQLALASLVFDLSPFSQFAYFRIFM